MAFFRGRPEGRERDAEAGDDGFAVECAIFGNVEPRAVGPENLGLADLGIDQPDQADTSPEIFTELAEQVGRQIIGRDDLDGEVGRLGDKALGPELGADAASLEERNVGLADELRVSGEATILVCRCHDPSKIMLLAMVSEQSVKFTFDPAGHVAHVCLHEMPVNQLVMLVAGQSQQILRGQLIFELKRCVHRPGSPSE